MVVGDGQLAGVQQLAIVLAEGLGQQGLGEAPRGGHQPLEVALGHSESHRDGRQLVDADDAVGVGGGDDVARIDDAHPDAAVDRRGDAAMQQVHPRAVQLALVDQHQPLVLLHQGRLGVDLLLGDGVLGRQTPVSLQVQPRLVQQGLIALQRALGLHLQGLVLRRIDLGEQLALADEGALADRHVQQTAVDLALDQDPAPGLGRAEFGDRDRQVLESRPGGRHRNHRRTLGLGLLLRSEESPGGQHDRHGSQNGETPSGPPVRHTSVLFRPAGPRPRPGRGRIALALPNGKSRAVKSESGAD